MTTSRVLSIALQDTNRPLLRPLPIAAAELLDSADAPPRLVAHLRAVHDVAGHILEWIETRSLDLGISPEAVLFGAATRTSARPCTPRSCLHPVHSTKSHADALRTLQVPTLVIHALDDTLIDPGAGAAPG